MVRRVQATATDEHGKNTDSFFRFVFHSLHKANFFGQYSESTGLVWRTPTGCGTVVDACQILPPDGLCGMARSPPLGCQEKLLEVVYFPGKTRDVSNLAFHLAESDHADCLQQEAAKTMS
jgi:hypothetical protein